MYHLQPNADNEKNHKEILNQTGGRTFQKNHIFMHRILLMILLIISLLTFNHDVLGVGSVEFLGQHVEEGGEVEGSGRLSHHLVDVLVLHITHSERHVAENIVKNSVLMGA